MSEAILIHPPSDEQTHAPAADPDWQESALFTWFDPVAGIGGFYRLGHEPHNSAANCCFGVFSTEGERFRWNVSGVPLTAVDRGAAHMGLGTTRADLGDAIRLRADFPDCAVDLVFEDYHPRYDYLGLVGVARDGFFGHHFEVAGRMTGRVMLGGREHLVDAQAYRDRSWGLRWWDKFRGSRWFPMVFGPDLSLQVVHLLSAEGSLRHYGYVIRDGLPSTIVESRMILPIEDDAFSYCGAQLMVTTSDGARLRIDHVVQDGIVLSVRGFSAMEGIGVATIEGRTGFANLEVSTNPLGGSQPPALVLFGNIGDGFSRR